MYTFDDCVTDTMLLVEKYGEMRNDPHSWDKFEFQNMRDQLAEALVFFGPQGADIRAAAEQAEVDRKHYYAQRRKYWRGEFKSARGTATTVEDNATIDCKDLLDKEVEANRKYYNARELVARIDQVLNGIASRLKIMEKHDKEG